MAKIVRGAVLATAVGSATIFAVGEAKAYWNEYQITKKLRYSFDESDRHIADVLAQQVS